MEEIPRLRASRKAHRAHLTRIFGKIDEILMQFPTINKQQLSGRLYFIITPRMRARGKVIVLYVCRHEIRQFAESTHLIYAYASQFSRCVQKMSFIVLKSFDIAQECHEQHLVLSHCCHAHILFYLKCFSHASQKCEKAFA